MKRSDLFQIPEKVFKDLCNVYDKNAGEYIDPKYLGKEIYEFYRSEMAILTKGRKGWSRGLLKDPDREWAQKAVVIIKEKK